MNENLRKSLLVIAVGLIIWFIPTPDGLTDQAWHLFACVVAIIVGFIVQPLPLGAVAFIGITVIATTGTLTTAEVLRGFSTTAMWLIVSAFVFARAFIKTGLGKRIAYTILKAIGGSTLNVGYALALSDLLLAPATPSSSARAGGIIFPVARSLSAALGSEPGSTSRKAGAYFLQVVYQTEGIVCAMFMTAMAGNPLIVELAKETAGVDITWGLWMKAAIVPGLIAFLLLPLVMYWVFPPELKKTPEAKILARDELVKMGKITLHEIILAITFVLVLILWCTPEINGLNATNVAMIAVSILFATGVLKWDDMLSEKGAWDTLVWMGALVGLASLLSSKGFIPWFSAAVAGGLTGVPWIACLALLVIIYIYSHYGFASLTAHISAMYAAFLGVAVAVGTPPYLAALALAFTANICLAITHYSGAPGPLYFGAGYVSIKKWWQLGFIFSIFNIIIWVGIGAVWWKILGLW